MSAPLLEVAALEAGYDDALILRGVDLTAGAEEIVAIVGPNGAGKSTLLKAVYGLLRPRGGTVRFAGDEVTGVRADRLTRRGLNFVPQVENVFPSLTIAENLHVGALVLSRAEREAEIARVLEVFPLLAERRRQRAGSLSGGQRKLVEIRALGIAIVMVEQNARRALALADRGYVLDMGRNAYTGSGRELLDDPRVVELYLGGSASGTMASSSTSTSTPSGMNPAT